MSYIADNDSFYALGGCGLSYWAENSNMDDTNMEVVFHHEYVIYQDRDNCYIGLKLTFSKNHIQINYQLFNYIWKSWGR